MAMKTDGATSYPWRQIYTSASADHMTTSQCNIRRCCPCHARSARLGLFRPIFWHHYLSSFSTLRFKILLAVLKCISSNSASFILSISISVGQHALGADLSTRKADLLVGVIAEASDEKETSVDCTAQSCSTASSTEGC